MYKMIVLTLMFASTSIWAQRVYVASEVSSINKLINVISLLQKGNQYTFLLADKYSSAETEVKAHQLCIKAGYDKATTYVVHPLAEYRNISILENLSIAYTLPAFGKISEISSDPLQIMNEEMRDNFINENKVIAMVTCYKKL